MNFNINVINVFKNFCSSKDIKEMKSQAMDWENTPDST